MNNENNRRNFLVGVISAFAAGTSCAVEANLGAEAAFNKASRVLVEMGALPTFRDKELLIIKAGPHVLQNVALEADCGSMFGIPYVKDKRTKVAATYEVTIAALGESKSSVSVRVTLDGYMDVNEGAPFFIEKTRDKSKALSCASTGQLESRFFERLAN